MAVELRVLIVEDQHDIAANIWDYLERRGYTVDHAADGEAGLKEAMRGAFDAIVLDLGLPKLDGLDLCRRLRESGRGVPVLMLTARDTLDDKLRGFSEGADDYMVKPFALAELEARLQALHRRGRPLPGSTLVCGDISYHPLSMQAVRAGVSFTLTRTQAQLLEVMLQQAPHVVTHQLLMRAVWGEDGGDIASLHSHIYSLRAMLDRPFDRPMIHSVHGIGYRIAGPADV